MYFRKGEHDWVVYRNIFSVTAPENKGRASRTIAPFAIGLTITILINVIGPLTDAGLNPARDMMPRIWACIVGWGTIAFGSNAFETCMVYIVGPLVGGVLAWLRAGLFPVALASCATVFLTEWLMRIG